MNLYGVELVNLYKGGVNAIADVDLVGLQEAHDVLGAKAVAGGGELGDA